MAPSLLAFGLVALLLVVTPGPDFAVVVPSALASRRAGIATALGTASGLGCHAIVAAAGLSVLLQASEGIFTVLKLAGAGYLFYLGVRALIAASRRSRSSTPNLKAVGSAGASSTARAYRKGLLTNLLNPKAPVIYLSVMPQFLVADQPHGPQLAAMSAMLVVGNAGWFTAVSFAVHRLNRLVQRVHRWIDAMTGVVLVGFGVRVLLQERPGT